MCGFAVQEWDDLGFGLTTKDTQMVVASCPRDGEWNSFKVKPYGPLALEPSVPRRLLGVRRS